MTDPDLAPWSEEIPAPRRTDAAFARSVRDEVRRRRARALFVAPLVAAASVGALALIVTQAPSTIEAPDAGTSVAIALDEDQESLFALPALDGSTDEELERLERALDRALEKKL